MNYPSHVKTHRIWKGLGTNLSPAENVDVVTLSKALHPTVCRVPLSLADPGEDAICLDDAGLDELWKPTVNSLTCRGLVKRRTTGDRFIFYGTGAPQSWLTVDGELRGDYLLGYARVLVAAVSALRKAAVTVTWFELLDGQDVADGAAGITPENYVILVRAFKTFLAQRKAELVKVLGPSLSAVVGETEYACPYVTAFLAGNGKELLDGWSTQLREPVADREKYNRGDYVARTYVLRQMEKTVRFMNWTNDKIPVFVTKMGTVATRFSTGINYGKGTPETVEHALRVIESLCQSLSAGASLVLPWTVYDKRDNWSLHRADSLRRPHCEALSTVNSTLPAGGFVYKPLETEKTPAGDQTIATVVVKGNSFGFILGRAHRTDVMDGLYQLKILNNSWSSGTESSTSTSTSFVATLHLQAFPTYVSLTGADKVVTVGGDGTLVLDMKELPYNCVIFGRGDVYATDLWTALPSCPARECVEIERVSDTSKVITPKDGCLVWSIVDKCVMTFVSGKWISCAGGEPSMNGVRYR